MLVDQPFNLRLMLLEPRKLSHVFRYSQVPMLSRENTAEHAYYAALYALFLGEYLRARGTPVNLGRLLEGALLHHLDKAVTGDVPRVSKHSSEELRQGLYDTGLRYLVKLSEGLSTDLVNPWLLSKADTVEGQALKLADLLAVVAVLHDEWVGGNRHVAEALREVSSHLRALPAGVLGEVQLQAVMFVGELLGT